MGPTAMWRPRHQNHHQNHPDGQICPVLRVEWLQMSGFEVALLKPDTVDSWMAKNGLYSLLTTPNFKSN